MKGLFLFVLAAAAIVIALFFLGSKPPAPPPAPAAATASPAPAAPVRPPVQMAGPAVTAGPMSMVGDPRVQSAAASARVSVRRFDRNGGKADVETEWSSDVTTQGMDFVEALRRAGVIRDFELESAKLSHGTTPDGRRLMIHRVTVIF